MVQIATPLAFPAQNSVTGKLRQASAKNSETVEAIRALASTLKE